MVDFKCDGLMNERFYTRRDLLLYLGCWLDLTRSIMIWKRCIGALACLWIQWVGLFPKLPNGWLVELVFY